MIEPIDVGVVALRVVGIAGRIGQIGVGRAEARVARAVLARHFAMR